MSIEQFRAVQETYTATGNSAAPYQLSQIKTYYWSIQVKGTTAAATSWDVRLEGSNDGVNFQQILQHNATDGSVVFSATPAVCSFYRIRVATLTLGSATNIVVSVVGA